MKVTTTIDREPLQDALFENVDRVMRAAGWRAASTAPYVIAPREGRYSRKLDGSLVSVATLGYDGVYHEPKTTERYAEASVGVTFPAAERLLAALRAPRDVMSQRTRPSPPAWTTTSTDRSGARATSGPRWPRRSS
jgi:hypothetical protein